MNLEKIQNLFSKLLLAKKTKNNVESTIYEKFLKNQTKIQYLIDLFINQ